MTTTRDDSFIVGAYEHPGRELPGHSVAQIHAEVALGALADAGLTLDDVDGYFCARDAPGAGVLSMAEYLGITPRLMDSTDGGGASPLCHVGHAVSAIRTGKCRVALVTLGGKPRTGPASRADSTAPEIAFEEPYGPAITASGYALAARRHMHEFGTTSAQLAEVKVAASLHAQHNPNAFLPKVTTVQQVLDSPFVSDPLHRDDCCVVTDGGGAVVVVAPEVARTLPRKAVKVLGHGESPKHANGGKVDLTHTGAVHSAPAAMAEAGVTCDDIDYASIYDSFTITVIELIEDIGFCEKGMGGRFVQDGALVAPHGRLPVNTDGGGLCNNHPANRGGMTRLIEAVRQLRGEAHPEVQVPDCTIALVQGSGGNIGTRMAAATLILGTEDS